MAPKDWSLMSLRSLTHMFQNGTGALHYTATAGVLGKIFELVVGIKHPFVAKAERGDGLSFGFIEDR